MCLTPKGPIIGNKTPEKSFMNDFVEYQNGGKAKTR